MAKTVPMPRISLIAAAAAVFSNICTASCLAGPADEIVGVWRNTSFSDHGEWTAHFPYGFPPSGGAVFDKDGNFAISLFGLEYTKPNNE